MSEQVMDIFVLRDRRVEGCVSYTRRFIEIANPRTRSKIDTELAAAALWLELLPQINPAFKPGETIDDLVAEGISHEEYARIFCLGKRTPFGKKNGMQGFGEYRTRRLVLSA